MLNWKYQHGISTCLSWKDAFPAQVYNVVFKLNAKLHHVQPSCSSEHWKTKTNKSLKRYRLPSINVFGTLSILCFWSSRRHVRYSEPIFKSWRSTDWLLRMAFWFRYETTSEVKTLGKMKCSKITSVWNDVPGKWCANSHNIINRTIF
jgi:hypothetical protein